MTTPKPSPSGSAAPAYDAVYDTLVRLCDAPESVRDDFRLWWEKDRGSEFRFIGALGFGGKFWRAHGEWYVNCYREDETPMRKLRIEQTNRALEVLRVRYA